MFDPVFDRQHRCLFPLPAGKSILPALIRDHSGSALLAVVESCENSFTWAREKYGKSSCRWFIGSAFCSLLSQAESSGIIGHGAALLIGGAGIRGIEGAWL